MCVRIAFVWLLYFKEKVLECRCQYKYDGEMTFCRIVVSSILDFLMKACYETLFYSCYFTANNVCFRAQ